MSKHWGHRILGVLLTILLAALTASAQEIRLQRETPRMDAHLVGRTLAENEARNVWARIDGMRPADQAVTFAQGQGVVEVTGNGNDRRVNFVTTAPTNGIIASRLVAPTGETVTFPLIDLSYNPPGNIFLTLWNGAFAWWPFGTTSFQVFILEGTKITMVLGVVNNAGSGSLINLTGSPQETVRNGKTAVALFGTGINPQATLVTGLAGGWVPVTFETDQSGTLYAVIPPNYGFDVGSTSLTVCVNNGCRTMSFEHSVQTGGGGKG